MFLHSNVAKNTFVHLFLYRINIQCLCNICWLMYYVFLYVYQSNMFIYINFIFTYKLYIYKLTVARFVYTNIRCYFLLVRGYEIAFWKIVKTISRTNITILMITHAYFVKCASVRRITIFHNDDESNVSINLYYSFL